MGAWGRGRGEGGWAAPSHSGHPHPPHPEALLPRPDSGVTARGGAFLLEGGPPEGTSGHLGLVSNFARTPSLCLPGHAQSRAPALCQRWVAETAKGCEGHGQGCPVPATGVLPSGQGRDPCTSLPAPRAPPAAASRWGPSCPPPACQGPRLGLVRGPAPWCRRREPPRWQPRGPRIAEVFLFRATRFPKLSLTACMGNESLCPC